MLKIILVMVFLSCMLTTQAQYPGYKSVVDLNRFKELFSSAAKNTETIKSDFVQEKDLSMLSEKIISKGNFWFKKDNKVRMEYTQPFQYLLIINQNNIYIKYGQKENKISTKSNKLFQQINKITLDCIQGNILNSAEYKIKVFENNQSFLIELLPSAKALKEFFKYINIFVSKKTIQLISLNCMNSRATKLLSVT